MKLGKPNKWCVTACAHMLLLGALPGFAPPLATARDVTFLVVSDVHYGIDQWGNNEAPNKAGIALMNNLPGTAWPGSGWGNVATPRGVLVSGDCTDSGTSSNWAGYWFFGTKDGFRDDYPERGGSGAKLHYPVYEGYGPVHRPCVLQPADAHPVGRHR